MMASSILMVLTTLPLLIPSSLAYNEEVFSFSDTFTNPYLYQVEDMQQLPDETDVDVHRRNNNNNFLRFGRNFEEEVARPTRKTDNSDFFIRFGRRNKDDFLRFGRNNRRDKREVHMKKKEGSSNFLRFGRRNGDSNFLRFGRAHGNSLKELLEQLLVENMRSAQKDEKVIGQAL